MALIIQTTGLEEYAPGGTARIKVLCIGGPGAGKTRWASYFPKPIYADCERGLASVADRKVPFVTINSSQDMLDLLAHLKQECRQPAEQRQYQTVVIDTLDAFQRKIKNEWMEKERKQVFTGWEAWGYLNARMQLLMTRLLNLDMNVVVAVHYKDRTSKDDETGKESHELMLQLQGELADTAFNDFDLVGWMGTYFEAVDGERVQKRGITFRPTPDKPFLKDRLHVTPPWMEVDFAPADYDSLFEAITTKLADIGPSTIIGEIVPEVPEANPLVVTPGAIGSGPIQGAGDAGTLTYEQMDKPTLGKLCRERGITTTVDAAPIRGNTLKAELIAALKAGDLRSADAPTPAAPAQTPAPAGEPEPPSNDPGPQTPEPLSKAYADHQVNPSDATQEALARQVATAGRLRREEIAAQKDAQEGNWATEKTSEPEPTPEQAVKTVEMELGGRVVQEPAAEPDVPEAKEITAEAAAPVTTCDDCGKDLAGEDPDFGRLSWIKFRKRLCEDDFKKRKNAR